MTLLGIDVSHHQGTPNFGAVKAAGNTFAFLKATEGVGYTDIAFNGGWDPVRKVQVPSNRAAARAAGLTVGAYHFASAGNPTAEADYFCSVVGPLQTGDLVVLDWETTAPNPPAWCKAWLDRVQATLGVKPLIYLNQSTRDAFDWSPVVAGNYGLWLAAYDNSPTAVPGSGRWPAVAFKQYTSAGIVPGVSGQVDRNVFFGDATALAAYGYQGDDMPLNDADKAWIAALLRPIGDTLTPGKPGVKFDGDIYKKITSAASGVASLLAQPSALDPKALAAAIVAALPAAQAQQVVDELGKRLNAPTA